MATVSQQPNPALAEARGLLPNKLEVIQLFLPLVILCAFGFIFTFFNSPNRFWANEAFINVIIGSFFLNVVHIGFTIAGQWSLTTYRSWRKYLLGESGSWRLWAVIALSLAMWVFLYLVFNRKIEVSFLDVSLSKWVICIFIVLLTWHAAHQTRGISLLYNRLPALQNEPKRREFARRERLGVVIMLVAETINDFVLLLLKNKGGWLYMGCTALGLAGAYIALKAAFQTDPNLRTNKFFFSLRYILLPIDIFSPVFPNTVRVLHGCEYALLNWMMLKRERETMDEQKSRRTLFFTLAILSVFFVLAWLASPVLGKFANSHGINWQPISAFASSFVITVTLLHMAWDRYFFSLENSVLRGEKIALLGLGNLQPQSIDSSTDILYVRNPHSREFHEARI